MISEAPAPCCLGASAPGINRWGHFVDALLCVDCPPLALKLLYLLGVCHSLRPHGLWRPRKPHAFASVSRRQSMKPFRQASCVSRALLVPFVFVFTGGTFAGRGGWAQRNDPRSDNDRYVPKRVLSDHTWDGSVPM